MLDFVPFSFHPRRQTLAVTFPLTINIHFQSTFGFTHTKQILPGVSPSTSLVRHPFTSHHITHLLTFPSHSHTFLPFHSNYSIINYSRSRKSIVSLHKTAKIDYKKSKNKIETNPKKKPEKYLYNRIDESSIFEFGVCVNFCWTVMLLN